MISATLLCLIVGITDANTLSARCGEPRVGETIQVRLAAIDAPARHRPHGQRAREALGEIALGKTAELRCGTSESALHRSCTVWVAPASAAQGPRTLDVGLALLTVGLACWNPAHGQSPQERGQYEFAQQEARAKRAGLWSDREPMAPWN